MIDANVLVISDDPLGTRPVVDELQRRGMNPFCVSLRDLARGGLSASIWSGVDGQHSVLRNLVGERFEIAPSSKVWRWKDRALSALVDLDTDSTVSSMKSDQYRSLLRALWESPAHWMNSRSAEMRLDQNKTYGATMASRHGLVAPPTLLTDCPNAIGEFVDQNPSELFAVKAPAMWAANLADGRTIATYTACLTRGRVEALASEVRHGPLIIQPYLAKAHELRVTVVGDQVFSCRIESQEVEATKVDWRMGPNDPVPYVATRLESSTQASLLSYMRECNLVYGSFDFIVTPEGELIFLEVNPAGQYLWIEQRTGLPITSAIADWLAGACV